MRGALDQHASWGPIGEVHNGPSLRIGRLAGDAAQVKRQRIGDGHMPAAPDQHRMVARRFVQFRRGWQTLLVQIHLVPGSRGRDPCASRGAGRPLPDQLDKLGQIACPIDRDKQAILRGENQMIMGIIERRQKRQLWIIQDARPRGDEPIQTVRIFRDRHNPFLPHGDSTENRAVRCHGVDGSRANHQIGQPWKGNAFSG